MRRFRRPKGPSVDMTGCKLLLAEVIMFILIVLLFAFIGGLLW